MNRLRGIREAIENGNRNSFALIQELSKGNLFLAKLASTTAHKSAPPQPRGDAAKLNISKDGEDLGKFDIAMVKTMLGGGQLTLQDYYFDTDTKEWTTLDCHPDFC